VTATPQQAHSTATPSRESTKTPQRDDSIKTPLASKRAAVTRKPAGDTETRELNNGTQGGVKVTAKMFNCQL
jgi:hypothetical protein